MEIYPLPELQQKITASLTRFRTQKNSQYPNEIPTDRFTCISCLSSIIRSKKGAYSEQERQDWLFIILACMYERDDFFPSYFDSNGSPPDSWNILGMFEYYSSYFNYQRAQYSGLYPYLNCAKSCYHSSNAASRQRQNNEFIAAVKGDFQSKLKQRAKKLRKQTSSEKLYEEFYFIFEENAHWFSNPVLFLFLPFFLFLNLAKCEGLLSPSPCGSQKDKADQEISPFSIANLDEESMRWFVRGTYLNIENETDYQNCVDLYKLVLGILISHVKWFRIHTIGLALKQAEFEARGRAVGRFTQKTEFTAFCFEVPMWRHNLWEDILFPLTIDIEKHAFSQKINQIFSLLYRMPSRQVKQALSDINHEYFKHQPMVKTESREIPFFDLLVSIGIVHSPYYFQSELPFENPELQNAIDILYDFFLYPNNKIKGEQLPISTKWLMVAKLRHNSLFSPASIDPNDSLFYSLLNQSTTHSLLKINTNQTNSPLFEIVKSSPIFQEIQEEMNDVQLIDQTYFLDISFWTGIQTRPHQHKLFNILNRCDRERPLPKAQQTKHDKLWERITNKTSAVPKLLSFCRSLSKVDATVRISTSGDSLSISSKNPDALESQKEQVLYHLSQIYGKVGSDVKLMDDERYLMLWYKIVEAIRTNMTQQVVDLSLRFLPLETN